MTFEPGGHIKLVTGTQVAMEKGWSNGRQLPE